MGAEEQNDEQDVNREAEEHRPESPSEIWGIDTNWPIDDQVAEVLAVDPTELRGDSRLGSDLAFVSAPSQLETIRSALRDLAEEDWERLAPEFQNEVVANVNTVVELLNQMSSATSGDTNIHSLKPELEERFQAIFEFFRTKVHEKALNARIRHELGKARAEEAPISNEQLAVMEENFSQLRANFRDLEQERDRVARELKDQIALVEAGRGAASASGAEALGRDYEGEAESQDRQWAVWGAALAVAVVLAGVVGSLFITGTRPDDDTSNARVASSIALDVLVVGLLIYVVRVTSHQFSVHRHLAAVARNKAAALSTFSRIAAGASDPETRTAMASVLAQSVFSSEQTGFIDASGNQVTLVERIAAPITQRAVNPPSAS